MISSTEQFDDICLDLPVEVVWQRTLHQLESTVSVPVLEGWIRPAQITAIDSRSVTIAVANEFARTMIAGTHKQIIETTISTVIGRDIALKVVVSPDLRSARYTPSIATIAQPQPTAPAQSPAVNFDRAAELSHNLAKSNLSSRHTFENFIVGSSNRFCHSAALAVADKPGEAYNPLFIYGGVGLGKTHLLHAIGNAVLERAPGTVVRYMSCEKFTNELVGCLKERNMHDFRKRYRQIDLLLLDDVQFIEKKDATQEELFHTFNALRESGKQIVLSSDRPPKALDHLTERLRSRFEWGLIADVQSPDYEMRLAILQRKAENERMMVSDDLLRFIAENFNDSVRDLEGALLRAHAYASLTGAPPPASTLRDILLPGSRRKEKRILTVEHVIDAVGSYFHIEPAELKSQKRSQDLTVPRHIAMYLAHELLSLSFPRIGAAFGGRKHTTVLYAFEKVKALLNTDVDTAEAVRRITRELQA